jgi:lipopolysaccharide transport system permease protein
MESDSTLSPQRQVGFDTGTGSQAQHAARDIIDGLANIRLWSMLGWRDIKQRYRRSTLGPLWVTISMALMISGLGAVYGVIFKTPLATYLPFLAAGLITWEFVSRCINEGCLAFLQLEGLIKQIRLPMTIHVASTIWKNAIVLVHNAIVYIVVALIFGVNPGWEVLWIFPGFLLLFLNLTWIILLLAILCTRFRDVPQLVQAVVNIIFFVTPVFWSPTLMPDRAILVQANVFYHMIDVIRSPLLGVSPDPTSWVFLIAMLIIGWGSTFLLFTKFRRRITYWL